MSGRQPDMKWNNAGLDAETQEEQHERARLLATRQMRGTFVKAGELRAAAGPSQKSKTKQQAPHIHVSHDDVQQSGPSGLRVFVIKSDQPIGCERHDLPGDQEQE